MTGVYVRAAALASALAPDLDSAVRRLQGAAEPPADRFDAGGEWPYCSIGSDDRVGWNRRAEAIARATARDLRTRAGLGETEWCGLPCIIGSSSYSVGAGDGDGWRTLEMPLDFCRRLTRWFGVDGPTLAVSTACTSGLGAIDLAAGLIADGIFRDVLVIGAELSNKLTVAGFSGLQLLSPARARPCDRARDGMVLGEALAAVLLSGEPSSWRVRAITSGLDAVNLTGLSADGSAIARVMRGAMAKAQWDAAAVDLLKLQASGSPTSDAAEMRAVHALFSTPPRSLSFKGALGHTLGASGPAELALLTRCLEHGSAPATWGFSAPDDAGGLAPRGGDATNVRRILFNLSGFGGHVMTLALERGG